MQMGDLVEKITSFFKNEDILDYFYTIFREHPELILIAGALIFILTLSLWTLAERLEKKGWLMLIPFVRYGVLFKAVGLNPFLCLLLFVPVVNFVILVIFNIHLCRKFSRNYIFVPLLILLPIVFLPVVAFGDGKHVYIKSPKREKIPREKRVKKARVKNATILSENPAPTPVETPAPAPAETPAPAPAEAPVIILPEPPTSAPVPTVALTVAELREKREQAKRKAVTPPPQMDFTPIKPTIPNEVLREAEKDDMPQMKSGPRARDIAYQAKKAKHTTEYEELLARQQSAQKKREAYRAKHPVKKPVKPPVAKPASKPTRIHVSVLTEKPTEKPAQGRQIPIE